MVKWNEKRKSRPRNCNDKSTITEYNTMHTLEQINLKERAMTGGER